MKLVIAEEMKFVLWYGEKVLAGDTPSPEETALMFKYRERTKVIARTIFKINFEDYKYTPGKPYK